MSSKGSCDCAWALTAHACDGGGDGSVCWLACCSAGPTPDLTTTTMNPFAQRSFYVNPTYRQHIRSTMEQTTDAHTRAALESLIEVPSAYWLDTKERISASAEDSDGGTDTLEGILANAALEPTPPLCVFIVYNLPNRDCKALASNGRICCTYREDGTCDYAAVSECKEGLAEYARDYIDPMRDVLQRYTQVPVALIIEPDSLPNLVTNQADPRCGNGATNAAYRQGVKYAVDTLHSLPSVSLYLDAAHGGWLGWPEQASKYAQLVAELGVHSLLRGFSVNVANYQPLGSPCPASSFPLSQYCRRGQAEPPACCRDMCHLIEQSSEANNELNYVQMLANQLHNFGVWSPHFVIDTGRNGVDDMRSDCSNWCNIRGAGLGLWPTADTALPDLVDAYYWLKTPGESDGCTSQLPDGRACPRYDGMCGSLDSLGSRSGEPFAPEAGQWWMEQAMQLASHEHIKSQTREVLGLVRPPRPPPSQWARQSTPAAILGAPPPPPPPLPLPSMPATGGAGAAATALLVLLPLLLTAIFLPALWLVCTRRSWRRLRGRRPLATGDCLESAADLDLAALAQSSPRTPGPSSSADLETAELEAAVARAELRVKQAELKAARERAALRECGEAGGQPQRTAVKDAYPDAVELD